MVVAFSPSPYKAKLNCKQCHIGTFLCTYIFTKKRSRPIQFIYSLITYIVLNLKIDNASRHVHTHNLGYGAGTNPKTFYCRGKKSVVETLPIFLIIFLCNTTFTLTLCKKYHLFLWRMKMECIVRMLCYVISNHSMTMLWKKVIIAAVLKR